MMWLAMPASRSLIALLVGTVAFFALWLLALKPGPSNTNGGKSSQGVGQYQSAINQAHQAVQTSNANNAASGNDGTPAGASSPQSSAGAATSSSTGTQVHPAASSQSASQAQAGVHSAAAMNRFSSVQHAVASHKVVAMLFYNPAATDDRAVKQELSSIPTRRGMVVKLTIPLSEAANYTAVTQQVPVNFSPTLVLIARDGQAGEILGYSDRFEIAQRVDDALAAK
jgi:hypothetical protein